MMEIDEYHLCNTIVFHTRQKSGRFCFMCFVCFFSAYSVMKSFVALIFVCIVLAEMQCDIQNPVVVAFKGKTNRA